MVDLTNFSADDLAKNAAVLNARAWDDVWAGIPASHPRNEVIDTTAGEGAAEGAAADAATAGAEAGSEAAAGAEGAASPEDRLLEALTGFQQDFTRRLDALDERIPAPAQATQQQAEEPSIDELMQGILNELPAENFDADGVLTPEGNSAAMFELAKRAVREELAPDRQREQEERRDREADALEEKYPRLQDQQFVDKMLDETLKFCTKLGRPDLAAEPAMLEQTYLAFEARQRAAAETPASGTPSTQLQSGTSAAPANQATAVDDGDRIVNLAKKQHFRLGS